MGYADYLKDLLRPLGVYAMSGLYGSAELESIGGVMDASSTALAELEKESVIPTAESYGLEAYEQMLPSRPAYSNLATRRAAIQALLRIDESAFTVDMLRSTISGCGISATVEETDKWYTVEVRFPEVKGRPEEIEKLLK